MHNILHNIKENLELLSLLVSITSLCLAMLGYRKNYLPNLNILAVNSSDYQSLVVRVFNRSEKGILLNKIQITYGNLSFWMDTIYEEEFEGGKKLDGLNWMEIKINRDELSENAKKSNVNDQYNNLLYAKIIYS
jgi:hypothetical protein